VTVVAGDEAVVVAIGTILPVGPVARTRPSRRIGAKPWNGT
jgi:hypothetical protein